MNNYKRRIASWNYGGQNWKLSRSKIDLFNECPRCFYLDNKLGIKRPSMPPFNLNSAVDALLKKEFDKYRSEKKTHPLMEKYKIDAIPFEHKQLDQWRDNFTGVQYFHEPTDLTVFGAVDDLWVKPNGELIVIDYKATSKDEEITLDDQWKEGYKRQMEVYQWLLRKNGFDVTDVGYFVYANAIKAERDSFDAKLEFKMTILDHRGETDWIEPTLDRIKETLDSGQFPETGDRCEHCPYFDLRLSDTGEEVVIE